MKEYWNKRYLTEGRIWGIYPSKTAEYALKLFKKKEVRKILIPGAGYGRNSKIFSDNGFDVVGVEISDVAFHISRIHDPQTDFYNINVLDMPFNSENFDGIYCYNTLHLFLEKERRKFLKKCYQCLRKKGIVFFIVFSEKEKSSGKGKELEKHTYESKPGRPTHYFSKEDLIAHFKNYKILETGTTEEEEKHGALGPHTHVLRYIFAQKI
jgi:SAM-dependent methyltransferase